MKNYDDIINLPHHVSSKRRQMSLENRAAQFAPFAALTGHSDAIRETERITNKKINIDETRRTILNSKLQILNNKIKIKPEIVLTYFVPDKTKNGGTYRTIIGNLKKIDIYEKLLIFDDKSKISLDDIYDIECDLFKANL